MFLIIDLYWQTPQTDEAMGHCRCTTYRQHHAALGLWPEQLSQQVRTLLYRRWSSFEDARTTNEDMEQSHQ